MFRDNPNYVDSVNLLLRLHKLMQRGEDESQEANEIRDAMDVPWDGMNQAEIERVDHLSADLTTLEPDPPINHPESGGILTDAMRQELIAHLAINDWNGILQLLRSRPAEVSHDVATFLRGEGWTYLGDNEAGLTFLESRMNLDVNAACAVIRPLLEVGRTNEGIEHARRLLSVADRLPIPHVLVLASLCCIISNHSPESSSEWIDRAIELFESARGKDATYTVPFYIDKKQWLAGHTLALAYCYLKKGDLDKARSACRDAMELTPENPDTLVLRAWLSLRDIPADANSDFERGFRPRVYATFRPDAMALAGYEMQSSQFASL